MYKKISNLFRNFSKESLAATSKIDKAVKELECINSDIWDAIDEKRKTLDKIQGQISDLKSNMADNTTVVLKAKEAFGE